MTEEKRGRACRTVVPLHLVYLGPHGLALRLFS
jgi:hypothetical protein